MNDTPKIRFNEFTDEWEQRKLGEISDKVTEKNAGLQYVETLTNSAEFGVISQRDFFDHSISKIDSLDGYYIVRSEDFVYNPRISVTAPVGPVNRNKLGRNGVMSPLYTVFRPHDVDNIYLEHFFKSRYWHSYMNFNGDSGARSDRFSIKDELFFQMPIPTPHIEEQQKIGVFLTSLDALILMIAFMLMPANQNALVPIMILMFAIALVDVSMKGVQFSVIDELGVDQKVNGMAIAIASLIGFNIPDVALHPIFGAILDKNEPVAAYKIIFACLLGFLILAFVVSLVLYFSVVKKKKAVSAPSIEQ